MSLRIQGPEGINKVRGIKHDMEIFATKILTEIQILTAQRGVGVSIFQGSRNHWFEVSMQKISNRSPFLVGFFFRPNPSLHLQFSRKSLPVLKSSTFQWNLGELTVVDFGHGAIQFTSKIDNSTHGYWKMMAWNMLSNVKSMAPLEYPGYLWWYGAYRDSGWFRYPPHPTTP